jgi:hypothetical protein
MTLISDGSTGIYPILGRFSIEYRKLHPQAQMSYDPVGSGGGIARILEGTVDFGATRWRSIASVVIPAAIRGLISGMMLNLATRGGGDRALAFYGTKQPVLESWLEPTDGHASGHDFQLCRLTLPRLAPPGLGCGVCVAYPGVPCEHNRPYDCRQRIFL